MNIKQINEELTALLHEDIRQLTTFDDIVTKLKTVIDKKNLKKVPEDLNDFLTDILMDLVNFR